MVKKHLVGYQNFLMFCNRHEILPSKKEVDGFLLAFGGEEERKE